MKSFRSLPLVALIVAACSTPDDASMPLPVEPSAAVTASAAVGQVYTSTNAVAGNAILAFDRAADGSLTPAGSYPTGGVGTGSGLQNQGGVTLSRDGRTLLVVNAGSNTVSLFTVRNNGSLEGRGAYPSGGTRPVSVTISGNVVYVLNSGSGNIAGFTVGKAGLASLAGSSQPVSAANAGSAQVQFDESGRQLVVTERLTNTIDIYPVDAFGVAGAAQSVVSSGITPFGFGIVQGKVIVSEAFAGATDGSAVSSYELGRAGNLVAVSKSVPTTETAACWVVVLGNGRFAYAANAGSASITGYAIKGGALSILNADGKTATTDAGPTDIAASNNNQFVYVLSNGGHTIRGFAVGGQGDLTPLAGAATGLPNALNGLAAR